MSEQDLRTMRINTFRGQPATGGMGVGTELVGDAATGTRFNDVLVPGPEYLPAQRDRPPHIRYHTTWEFDLNDPQVRRLVQEGVLVHAEKDSLQELTVAAIRRLDPSKAHLWTDDGKPLVRAIEDELGENISAEDRDVAWHTYQQRKQAEAAL